MMNKLSSVVWNIFVVISLFIHFTLPGLRHYCVAWLCNWNMGHHSLADFMSARCALYGNTVYICSPMANDMHFWFLMVFLRKDVLQKHPFPLNIKTFIHIHPIFSPVGVTLEGRQGLSFYWSLDCLSRLKIYRFSILLALNVGNQPETCGFLAQRASDTESVTMSRYHHAWASRHFVTNDTLFQVQAWPSILLFSPPLVT